MRLLLDTHTLVWTAFMPHLLSPTSREAICNGDNEVYVSAITAMEIATKVAKGKFEDARPLAKQFAEQVRRSGFELLSVTAEHGERAGNLVLNHKGPWNRLLIAQAQIEDLVLVTSDKEIKASGISILW
jgi:PIN domain nuclease of toxin-antitoxin system